MAHYTQAYSKFVKRMDEVNVLRRFAVEKERKDAITNRKEINAFCRGAIVLLSGSLEAFIKELGEVLIDALYIKQVTRTNIHSTFFYHLSKKNLDEIFDARDPKKIADKMFSFLSNDLSYWSRSGPFPNSISVEMFNKGFSNPIFEKICRYFNRFGYFEYKDNLANLMKARYITEINMVNQLVDLRNKIAHGNPQATKTPSEVKEMMDIIRNFCNATDKLFSNWCKTQFCSIK